MEISRNDITATSIGVEATTLEEHPSFVIENNKIHMNGGVAGISSVGLVEWLGPQWASDMVVANNKISGQADYGIYISPEPAAGTDNGAYNNVFRGNNLATLNAPIMYYFGVNTSGNQVIGYSGGCDAVVDLGTDNSITGCGNQGKGQGAVAKPAVRSSTWGEIKALSK